jgi:hypothetical protein
MIPTWKCEMQPDHPVVKHYVRQRTVHLCGVADNDSAWLSEETCACMTRADNARQVTTMARVFAPTDIDAIPVSVQTLMKWQ